MNKTARHQEVATPASAIMLVIVACMAFSLLDACAKYLVQQGMAAPFAAWARFAVHTLMVLVLFRGWTNRTIFRTTSIPAQVLRGFFLFGATMFNFIALQTLQLAETIAIFFLSPMLITALAGPLLGERVGWRRWLAVAVGFAGMLVVTRPGFGAFAAGHAWALASMTSYSIYVIMTRRMGATETTESLIFYSALAPAVLMLPLVPFYGSLPQDWLQWALILSIGFLGAFGHWLLIRAYKQATTAALAPYPYSQIVWMIGLGWLVFADLPDLWTLAGAAIIVSSGLYIIHREQRLRRQLTTGPAEKP